MLPKEISIGQMSVIVPNRSIDGFLFFLSLNCHNRAFPILVSKVMRLDKLD